MTHDHQLVLEVLSRHVNRPASDILREVELSDLGVDSLKFLLILIGMDQTLKRKVTDLNRIAQVHTVQDLLDLSDPPAQTANRRDHHA